VADGMGGHQAGEVASEITVNAIRNACTPAPIGSSDTGLALSNWFSLRKIFLKSRRGFGCANRRVAKR